MLSITSGVRYKLDLLPTISLKIRTSTPSGVPRDLLSFSSQPANWESEDRRDSITDLLLMFPCRPRSQFLGIAV